MSRTINKIFLLSSGRVGTELRNLDLTAHCTDGSVVCIRASSLSCARLQEAVVISQLESSDISILVPLMCSLICISFELSPPLSTKWSLLVEIGAFPSCCESIDLRCIAGFVMTDWGSSLIGCGVRGTLVFLVLDCLLYIEKYGKQSH